MFEILVGGIAVTITLALIWVIGTVLQYSLDDFYDFADAMAMGIGTVVTVAVVIFLCYVFGGLLLGTLDTPPVEHM